MMTNVQVQLQGRLEALQLLQAAGVFAVIEVPDYFPDLQPDASIKCFQILHLHLKHHPGQQQLKLCW